MSFPLMYRRYRGYLKDDEIETGKDYLYCPLNKPPKHVRITGYAASKDGTPIVFFWHEVKSDGSLSIVVEGTLSLFKAVPEEKQLVPKIHIPIDVLLGVFTAQLRRPKTVGFGECRC